ncbi:MAG: hypothetical protein WA610_06790 [Thermodesulfovibrionales bacterium]
MRVTEQMQYNMIRFSLQDSVDELARKNNQLMSGKKADKPSDDVLGTIQAMAYKVSLSANTQYLNNVDLAGIQLSFMETAVESISSTLDNIHSLIRKGVHETAPEQKTANSNQASQWRDMLLDLSNTTYGNKYLFSGCKTDQQSFTYNAATFHYDYNGDTESINIPVEKGVTVPVNVQGSAAFSPPLPSGLPAALPDGTPIAYTQATNPANGINTLTITIGTVGNPGYDTFTTASYMDMLNTVSFAWKDQNVDGTALDPAPAMGATMGNHRVEALSKIFDTMSSQVFQVTSDISMRMVKLDDEKKRLNNSDANLLSALSKVEDADINQVAVDIKTAQISLDAIRATAAKILSQSIFDFLR